jgi:hypothetical protein
VSVEVFLGSSLYGSATRTTGSDEVVKFVARAAPPSCYISVVTALNGVADDEISTNLLCK